jgi:hypothetical protein
MSSTNEIQLSDVEMEALAAKIEAISPKEKVKARPVLRALLGLINKPADTSSILHEWLSKIQSTESVIKVFHPVLPISACVCD